MFDTLSPTDLRALHVFRAIAECGGFSGAEEKLNVNQSTMSIQLAKLEERLGYRLCERGRGGFRLTERGRVLLGAFETLRGAIDDFQHVAADLSDRIVGTLRLGILDHTVTDERFSIVALIRRFLERAPEVRLEIVQDIQSVLRDHVQSSRLDLAIGAFEVPGAMVDADALYMERQYIHCGPLHPFFEAEEGTIDAAALEGANWVRRNYALQPRSGFPFRMTNSTATAANLEAVAVILQASPAIGFLPDHFAQQFVRRGLLRRVTERYFIEYDIVLLSRAGRRDTAAMRKFRAVALDLARGR